MGPVITAVIVINNGFGPAVLFVARRGQSSISNTTTGPINHLVLSLFLLPLTN